MLLNVAYAFLAGELDAADRVTAPAFLSAGEEPQDVEARMKRPTLDEWLDEPLGPEADAEKALLTYLKGA